MTERIRNSLEKALAYSERRDYAGYSKFDALNSPFAETLFGWSFIGRLLITQLVNRSYLHLRPLLGVRKSRNPKGIANFTKAYCNLFVLRKEPRYRSKAVELADWLLLNHSGAEGNFSGLCWGYNFPWQSPGFFAPRHFPNCIVTVFAGEALLKLSAAVKDEKYLAAAEDAALFILRDLPVLEENSEIKCIGYVTEGLRWKVININAVAAGFLAKLWRITKKERYADNARKMIAWVIRQRTDYDAWHYTVPPGASGIGHDNYHTGGILDGIIDYMINVGDESFKDIYLRALDFYRNRLFEPDGAPRLTSDKKYPFDIHGAAQGIITFAKAAHYDGKELDVARKIADWAIVNMQDEDGHFYYRKHRCFTRKECLMRWNNSWMSWALSELLIALSSANRLP